MAEDKSKAVVEDKPATPAQEVAGRTIDLPNDKPTTTHRKVIVAGPGTEVGKDYDHDPNIEATRQYMIQQGLWPKGDVKFVGQAKHADGVSIELTYEGEAVPAHDAPDSLKVSVIEDESPSLGASRK